MLIEASSSPMLQNLSMQYFHRDLWAVLSSQCFVASMQQIGGRLCSKQCLQQLSKNKLKHCNSRM